MLFIPGELVPNSHTPNSYEVEITVMFGDADGYQKITVGPFKRDEEEHILVNLLETLVNMKNAYPYGRGGDDNYYAVEGYSDWFAEEWQEDTSILSPTAKFLQEKEYYFEWPYDPTNEGTQAGYDSHEIFYYDENKNKHTVTVENGSTKS